MFNPEWISRMSLFIKDPEVGALVKELQAIMHGPTKTEAVKTAIKEKIAREKQKMSRAERLESIQRRYREMGQPDPGFDFKVFADDLYEGM
jgi:antitoxin VapB